MTDHAYAVDPPGLHLTNLVRAELRRLVGDGRLVWAILAVVAATAIGAIVIGLTAPSRGTAVTSTLTAGLGVAATLLQILAILVGADAFAGEFARGTIDATHTIVPRRGLLLAGRACSTAVVLGATGLIAGIVAGILPLVLGLVTAAPLRLADIWSWLYGAVGLAAATALVGFLALAVGLATKQRTVTILGLVGVLYLAPVLVGLLPDGPTQTALASSLPSSALSTLTRVPQRFDAALGVAILDLSALTVVAAIISVLTLKRGNLGTEGRRRSAPKRITHQTAHRKGPIGTSMRRQLHAEFVKLTTEPALRVFVPVAIVVALGFSIARSATDSISGVGGSTNEGLLVEFPYAVTSGVGLLAIMTSVLAVALVATEHETGTAAVTFVAAHPRRNVTTAKALIALLIGGALAVVALAPAFAVSAGIYTLRGYHLSPDVLAAGGRAALHAGLFLVLATMLSAGFSGITRRAATSVLLTVIAMTIGPATFNVILGFARATDSPLVALGNLGRFLPWEGSTFFGPDLDSQLPVAVDPHGVLQLSPVIGIIITASWALASVIAWYVVDSTAAVATP